MSALPRGGTAVMQRRHEPPTSLDFLPTPPWAVRAFTGELAALGPDLRAMRCWEPACGEGSMVRALAERFGAVVGSDVHDYRCPEQRAVCDFLIPWDRPSVDFADPDWIITNPPFRLAEAFVLQALTEARRGVAMLVRSAFLESGERFRTLFTPHPPAAVFQFVERVPIFRGRLDPNGSSATAYSWVVWLVGAPAPVRPGTSLFWIPPCRAALERPDDYPPPPGPLGDLDQAALFAAEASVRAERRQHGPEQAAELPNSVAPELGSLPARAGNTRLRARTGPAI